MSLPLCFSFGTVRLSLLYPQAALMKVAPRGLVICKLFRQQEHSGAVFACMCDCELGKEGVVGWGWAGNPLFMILQISESFSFSVGAHVINPQIICGLFLAFLAPPPAQWKCLSISSHTFSFSYFAVISSIFFHFSSRSLWHLKKNNNNNFSGYSRLWQASSQNLFYILAKDPPIYGNNIVQF